MPVVSGRITRTALATLLLLALGACFMSPGKFTSSLDIRADRSFTFLYKGEVIVEDMSNLTKGLDDLGSGDDEDASDTAEQSPVYQPIALADQDKGRTTPRNNPGKGAKTDSDSEEKLAKMRDITEALMKEEGYRSVRYVGNNKFEIDYQISGRLDHSFVFPFNVDAQAAFPFLVIEVRKDGRVRVQAPGFGESSDSKAASSGMGTGKGSPEREGVFTLTTNAEIVSQNEENGATSTAQGKQVVWKITPYTRVAPAAVLKLAAAK